MVRGTGVWLGVREEQYPVNNVVCPLVEFMWQAAPAVLHPPVLLLPYSYYFMVFLLYCYYGN